MSWYEKENIILPKLRKCHHCKKRLSNPVITEWGFFLDGADIYHYCSEECVKSEIKQRNAREEDRLALNKRIWGMK